MLQSVVVAGVVATAVAFQETRIAATIQDSILWRTIAGMETGKEVYALVHTTIFEWSPLVC